MSLVIQNSESPAPNVRLHRSAREGEGQTRSGHKGSLWSIRGRLFPLHLLSMRRETLLRNTQLKQVHLCYLEVESWLSSPSDRKPKVEKNNTQNDPPTPMGPVLRLRRDRPGSCSVDRGWGSQGCERPSCHFEGATSVSLGHEWSLLMLRRHVQPVGGDNQKSEEGRQRHPPGQPRRPSFHVTRSSSIGTLSGYKLPIMPSLAYYPIMPQLNPGGPQAPHSQKHLTPASSSCLQSLCPQGSAAQSHREDSRPPHCTSSSQMLPFPGPNPAAHTASRAWPQPSC